MNDNVEKIKEYRLIKLKKILLIFLLLMVMILEALALFNVISCVWGFIPFGIVYLFKLNKNSNKGRNH